MPSAKAVVSEAMTSLSQDRVPPVLRERIEQHERNLTALAVSLLQGGQDVAQVRRTIAGVLESFEDELARTIIFLREDADAL